MACFSWVCNGDCPYDSRCVFLHDPRLCCSRINKNSVQKIPYIFKAKGRVSKDTFYWPDMSKEQIQLCYESDTGLPSCDQPYEVPTSFSEVQKDGNSFHNRALFSLWNHFVDYIVSVNLDQVQVQQQSASEEKQTANKHLTSTSRLPIFVNLASFDNLKLSSKRVDCEDTIISKRYIPPQSDEDDVTSGCDTDSDEDDLWLEFKELNSSTCRILGPDYFCETMFRIPAKN